MISEEIYTKAIFFDSYAFFEILKGNERYSKYKEYKIVTTKLNLFELYFGLLKDTNEADAEKYLNKYYPFVVEFDHKVIAEAARLKMKLNRRNVSMTDCIGYITSLNFGIKFLTGDKEFENFKNAEFVK